MRVSASVYLPSSSLHRPLARSLPFLHPVRVLRRATPLVLSSREPLCRHSCEQPLSPSSSFSLSLSTGLSARRDITRLQANCIPHNSDARHRNDGLSRLRSLATLSER